MWRFGKLYFLFLTLKWYGIGNNESGLSLLICLYMLAFINAMGSKVPMCLIFIDSHSPSYDMDQFNPREAALENADGHENIDHTMKEKIYWEFTDISLLFSGI